MSENYNLKRFYDEAWELLVKYDFVNEQCRLRVSFDYNDKVLHTPEVDCSIAYSNSNKGDKQILIMGYGPSPFCALRKFELDLMQTKEGYPLTSFRFNHNTHSKKLIKKLKTHENNILQNRSHYQRCRGDCGA